MRSFREILSEAAINGDPDQMAVPYADTLAKNVNVREIPSGSNRSKEIDRYFDLVGLDNRAMGNKGYPWCAAFVYAMFDDFCKEMGVKNPVVRTAGVLKHWNRADASLKIPISKARSNPSLVKPGQVFIQSRKGGGHTGIVTAVDSKNKTFTTIEGNTNDKLSGEGHRVGRNTRKMSQGSLLGFIDYFKGHRNDKFEQTVAKTVANAKTDFSSEEYVGGLSKNDIKDIQSALKKAGYDLGNFGPNKDGVDGELGTKTNNAIADWKSKNNIKSDAPLDKSLLASITKGAKYVPSKSSSKGGSTSTNTVGVTVGSPDKFIEKLANITIPTLLPGSILKVDNKDISTSSDFIIKRAVIEHKNSISKFSDMILEKGGLKRFANKIKDIKQASDTRLADMYRDGRVKSSPIDGTGPSDNILSAPDSGPGKTSTEPASKPQVDIVYNKKLNKFYLKPYNKSGSDKLGTNNAIELSPEDAKFVQNIFKEAGQTSTNSTDTSTSTNLNGKVTHKYTGTRAKNINVLINKAKSLGITNPHSLIGMLTVIGKETHFKPKSEYSYSGTSNARLRDLFSGPLKHLTDSELSKLKMNDVAFYDVIYGHIGVKNGYHTWNNKKNDPVLPGDGYKYRGRGFNGITFKQQYKQWAKDTGLDLVNNPDLLNNVDTAAEVAIKYFINSFKKAGIDINGFANNQDAIAKYAGANAGWGNSPNRAIASANKILPNFNIA